MGIFYTMVLFLIALFTGIFMMTTENSIIQVCFCGISSLVFCLLLRIGLEKGWLHFKSNLLTPAKYMTSVKYLTKRDYEKTREAIAMSVLSSPEEQIKNLEAMKYRSYSFHKGDKVRVNDLGHPCDGEVLIIDFPYCGIRRTSQMYVLYPLGIPVSESILSLVEKDPDGHRKTINFFNECIDKLKKQV